MNRLDFNNRADVKAWLDDIAQKVDDLAGVLDDALAPADERDLGPKQHRRLRDEAVKALTQQIASARAGLE